MFTSRSERALLTGLRRLVRARDITSRVRWQAIRQLTELEQRAEDRAQANSKPKTNKLRALLKPDGEPMPHGSAEQAQENSAVQ